MATRAEILVRGMVQGVGFRPFVYATASRRSLTGSVRNSTAGVLIEVHGDETQIQGFLHELETNHPPLSIIESIECWKKEGNSQHSEFVILESDSHGEKAVAVSPDVTTCADCLSEMFDPTDRRYRYPFINCTNCGPRFTIVKSVPYDRVNTTMRSFEMCSLCKAEYEDPLNRRFHAEPIACPDCGPSVKLLDARENDIANSRDAIEVAGQLLLEGKIVAIKGIGGFHLACDAQSQEAVNELRRRKVRYDKAFALMAESLDVVSRYCFLADNEKELLLSGTRPIVLLKSKGELPTESAIAPGVTTLGFMLPYSPLHQLLFRNLNTPLVLTSGNLSDEPICFKDCEVIERLNKIADYFLVHNREIKLRTDDSVFRVVDSKPMALRRSRGYAPMPLKTSFKFTKPVLACGAELKNTFCLGRDHDAFISHHIGDLENLETFNSFSEGIEHFKQLFEIDPEAVAYDLHPEYLSTKYALGLDGGATKIGVQHHHAHIASCMADNGIDGPVIGVAFDGLGFGADGTLWGGEFMVADFVEAERVAHFAYTPLPGGVSAIREPWRMAAAYLQRALGDDFVQLDLSYNRRLDNRHWPTLRKMIENHVNSPQTSSCGRLFDAVASILSVRDKVNYEGQAAIELEALIDANEQSSYEFDFAESVISADNVIRRIVDDLLCRIPVGRIAAKFHNGLTLLVLRVVNEIRSRYGLERVALSGGVFQNVFLLESVCRVLRESGLEVFTHGRVPTNDGGISLGQAAIANARLK